MTANEIIQKLLGWRWKHVGMDAFTCASCGARATENFEQEKPYTRLNKNETHSKNCPFFQADEYLKKHEPSLDEIIEQVSKFSSVTILEGKNETEEDRLINKYADGVSQGYNDAVSQIVEFLKDLKQ